MKPKTIVAIDLGQRTGVAVVGGGGRRIGKTEALRKFAEGLEELGWLRYEVRHDSPPCHGFSRPTTIKTVEPTSIKFNDKVRA